MKFILIIIITMGAMGHTKTIEMKIPQENKKECLKFAKTFELKLPIADIVMSMKSRCEPTESYLVSIKPNQAPTAVSEATINIPTPFKVL